VSDAQVGVLPIARSTCQYQSRAPQHTALRQRIRDLALSRVGWGYRRLTTVLQREGWSVGRKLVYRLYREGNLLLRPKKKRRRVSHQARILQSTPDQLNEQWRIRVLTRVDDFSRESVYIGGGSHFRGIQVAQTLASVARRRSVPKKIRVDKGPEFTSVALDQWAYWNEVQLVFSRPATPTDNAHIESFNARLRQECLNAHWFESMEEARSKIRAWQHQYNEEHPHSALGYLTPNAFAKTHANSPQNRAQLSRGMVPKGGAA
jgi:putative transposase